MQFNIANSNRGEIQKLHNACLIPEHKCFHCFATFHLCFTMFEKRQTYKDLNTHSVTGILKGDKNMG